MPYCRPQSPPLAFPGLPSLGVAQCTLGVVVLAGRTLKAQRPREPARSPPPHPATRGHVPPPRGSLGRSLPGLARGLPAPPSPELPHESSSSAQDGGLPVALGYPALSAKPAEGARVRVPGLGCGPSPSGRLPCWSPSVQRSVTVSLLGQTSRQSPSPAAARLHRFLSPGCTGFRWFGVAGSEVRGQRRLSG